VLAHFTAGAKKGAERGARESTAHADALDADCRKLSQAKLNTAQSHKDIHRPIDGADYGRNFVFRREARCIENIGAGFLVSLETRDGVVEIRPVVQVIFGASGEGEGEGKRACYRGCRADSLHRVFFFVDWLVRAIGGIFD